MKISGCGNSRALNRRHHASLAEKYDLVLHIGAPKAGSSAIQAFLVSNRKVLEKAGFYYPQHGLDVNRVSGGHAKFGIKLIEDDLPAAAEYLESWLTTACEKKLCLLLSAESFYRQPQKLKKLTIDLDVKVLAYFRDPIESMISNYNQSVKRHFNTQKFKAFAKRQLKLNTPDKSGEIFKIWIEGFGRENLLVLPYDKDSFPDKMIELSFLYALGVPKSLLGKFNFRDKPINASYTPSALELKRLLNMVLDRDNRKMNHRVDWPLQKYSDLSSEIRPTAEEILGADLYAAFTEKFRSTNAFMKAHILNFYSEGFLEYPSAESVHCRGTAVPAVSLQQVMADAFSDKMDIVQYIFQQVTRKLTDGQAPIGEVRKLAALLNIDIESIDSSHAVFDPRRLAFRVSPKAKPSNGLRKLFLFVEQCGRYNSVVTVVRQILKWQLIAPVIKIVFERLRGRS